MLNKKEKKRCCFFCVSFFFVLFLFCSMNTSGDSLISSLYFGVGVFFFSFFSNAVFCFTHLLLLCCTAVQNVFFSDIMD